MKKITIWIEVRVPGKRTVGICFKKSKDAIAIFGNEVASQPGLAPPLQEPVELQHLRHVESK